MSMHQRAPLAQTKTSPSSEPRQRSGQNSGHNISSDEIDSTVAPIGIVADANRVTTTEKTWLRITLPGIRDHTRSWVAEFRKYPSPPIQGTTPLWSPFSREAAHESQLQLTTVEDLVQKICQNLLQARKMQGDPEVEGEPGIDMPDESWQVAVTTLHVARIRPDSWKDMIQTEFLRQLRDQNQISTGGAVPPTRCEEVERAVETAERHGCVPLFAHKVMSAWKSLTRRRKKQAVQLRDGPAISTAGTPPQPVRSFSSKSHTELPPMARFTPAAQEEIEQMVATITVGPSMLDENVEERNEQQFERIRALARDLARQKGSTLVHYRDVRRSAEILDTSMERKSKPNPAEETPEHFDEVVDKLSALKAEQLRLSRGGVVPPKVLVIGESGSEDSPPFVAKMFQDAGADVATCDLKGSTAEGIPHFCGDAAQIQDLGWDLVIGHPPCTFLSNASIKWLKNNPFRRRQMYQNAAVFRRFRDAQAPFVAIENSKMGPEARKIVGESPTQYIHPWQHGHGQTKPTALYLDNLPPIAPTKIVYGREHSLSRHPPDSLRTERKSKTYMGIAAAMATQWTPVLQRYIQSPYRKRSAHTAQELVAQAGSDLKRVVRIALIDRVERIRVLVLPSPNGKGHDLPERTLDDPAQSGQMLKELLTWMEAEPAWYQAVEEGFLDYPEGHRSFYEVSDGRFANRPPTLCHLWVIRTPMELCTDPDRVDKGINRTDLKWIPIGSLQAPSDQNNGALQDRYRQTILQYGTVEGWFHPDVHVVTVATDRDSTLNPSSWRQPWLVDHEDLPPPPPAPRHIRRRYGQWRVWDVVGKRRDPAEIPEEEFDEHDPWADTRGWRPSDLLFEWRPLPARIGNALDQHLGLPFKPLPGTVETSEEGEIELGFWHDVLRVTAESILGNPKDTNALREVCITDPAGLPFILSHGPKRAKAASEAIYKLIGLKSESLFPDPVRARIRLTGDAVYHHYEPYHVIHVVGPDLRVSGLTSESIMEELTRAYQNVLKEWLSSGVPSLRLLPISGGTFAGPYFSDMPRITAEAVGRALDSLSLDEKAELRFRSRQTKPEEPIQMCIFARSQFAKYKAAVCTALADLAVPEEERTQPRSFEHEAAAVLNHIPLDLSTLRSVSWNAPKYENSAVIDEDTRAKLLRDDVETWWAQHHRKLDSTLPNYARELWDRCVRTKHEQQFGLGVTLEAPPSPRTSYPRCKGGVQRLLKFIRGEHAKFILGDRNQDHYEPLTNKEAAEQDIAYAAYDRWVDLQSRPAARDQCGSLGFRAAPSQEVNVVEGDQLPEPSGDLALTPSLGAYTTSALYVSDFRVRRRKTPIPEGSQKDDVYTVNHVVMPTRKILADTGAAPSVITTQLLEKLPRDSCVSRDARAQVGPLNGANGKALITFGTATIDFELGKTPCRHRFAVIQGRPLVLLGNDFLAPRKAQIQLNSDGKGGGRVSLTSQNHKGDPITHEFDVTNRPGSSEPLCPVTADNEQQGTESFSNSPTVKEQEGGEPERLADPLPKPEKLVDGVLGESEWELENSEYLLYTTTPVVVPPLSRMTVRVRAPQALMDKTTPVTCIVDRIHDWDELSGLPQSAKLIPAPPVVTRLASVIDGQVDVQLVNGTRHRITVAGFSPLAKLDAEYYVRGCLDLDKLKEGTPQPQRDGNVGPENLMASLSETERELLESISIDPEERLDEEQLKRVKRMVANNIQAFATDPKNPTKTHLMEVELPLKPDATPHRHAASRVGEEGRRVIEKHVEEMESRGIIRKSNSEWGSRVVLVTKKDGSVRFCVDYRDLNSKLKLQDSPIPLTMEALDRLSSGEGCPTSLFLSTLDLASGFWTLPVKEEDKELTAFVTHRQKYEFNYLPFGIQSGPSYMVRLMDAALQGLAWESCMPYLDDIGVWSTGSGSTAKEREANSFEQMLTRLQAVFQRLRWAGLSMKASKCVLFATKAEYLGHVVSREGLRMDPKKIEVVRNFQPTEINTVTKVRSFLGLCSYYRRFIEGFSKMAAPLTDLTRDGVDVEAESQTPECQAAFRKLIDAVTSEPVMCTPRFDRPFVVKTDAANQIGLGGVLSQADDEEREKVVAYHGRRLTKHERNYTVTEIELLAAVDCIRHWRSYLWGRAFKLVIDHSALRWLHTMRDTVEGGPSSRLMRWILKLAEYRFHVEHKPGVLHKDADAISRLVTDGPEQGDPEAMAKEEAEAPLVLIGSKTENESDADEVAAVTSGRSQKPRPRHATARSVAREQRERQSPEAINTSYLATGAPSLHQIRLEQERDPECQEMARYLQGELDDISNDEDLKRLARAVRHTTSNRHNRRASEDSDGASSHLVQRIVQENDVLYRVVLTPNSTDEQAGEKVPYVPQALRLPLMVAFHERMGHASKDRVAAALRRRFYWPKLTQDVADHIADCHECTLAKTPNVRNRNPVGPTVGRYPFDLVYADILDMTNTYDYDASTGAGHRKLAVFVDSLSRWAEAIPLHKDPSAAELLDIFHGHIVARHGVPRILISDRGSNLVSALNSAIFNMTGVDLHGTTAEHKEANGVVERFNQTLLNMVRASNLGGAYWRDHLPFVLMAYRATPHRVTKESPSMLLYGREMRVPAQIGDPNVPPATITCEDPSGEIKAYATRLHNRLVYAWKAAYGATREAQGATVSNTAATSIRGQREFQVGDRVVRRLYDEANCLEAKYAGPYRVAEVLGKGRYRLRDLENKLLFNEFDISNLRIYTTPTEDEPLEPDEYIVERLLARRWVDGQKQYRVKYRGYAAKESLWTSSEELSRRCQGMMDDYDKTHPVRKQAAGRQRKNVPTSTSAEAEAPTGPEFTMGHDDEEPNAHLPEAAKFIRGRWHYGRKVRDRRTTRTKIVWKDDMHYTIDEIGSELFARLRREAEASAQDDPDVAAIFSQLTSAATAAFGSKPDKAQVAHDLTPPTIQEEPLESRAVRVWFITNEDILSFGCSDSQRPDIPRMDTFGGDMTVDDEDMPNKAALRMLSNTVTLPASWEALVRRALNLDHNGQDRFRLITPDRAYKQVIVWYVRLSSSEAREQPQMIQQGTDGPPPPTVKWRAHGDVLSNISNFPSHMHLGRSMGRYIVPLSAQHSLE